MRNKKVRRNNGRAVEASVPSVKNDFVKSIKPVTEVPHPSFEFYVWSDEGINLQVDLTSSSSDWTNKFKNEVRVSDTVNGNKSWSLRQNLSGLREKSSLLWNKSYCQIVDRDGHAKSSSSGLKLMKDCVAELDQQKRPVMSYSVIPCRMSDPSTPELQHSKSYNQCSGNCDLPNGSCIVNPGVVCARASLSSSVEAAKIVDGRMRLRCSQFDDPLKKSRLDSDGQVSKTELRKKKKNRYSEIQGSSTPATRILRSMKKTSFMVLPSSPVELQNSAVATSHKYASVSPCGNDGSLDLSDSKNTSEMEQYRLLKSSKINFVNDGTVPATRILRSMKKTSFMVLPSSPVELQNSAVATSHKYASVSPCGNDGSLDLSDPKNTSEMEQYRLLKSSEINFVNDGNDHPSQTEEWEAAKIVDGRMHSRCSQIVEPLNKSSLDSDDQVSEAELHKKRKTRYSEIQGSSTPATRILRSMTKTAVNVLPSSSLVLQNLEFASCHKDALVSPCNNDGSLDLSDPKNSSEREQYGLLNSSEINFVADANDYPSQTEELEVAKIVDGRTRSRCSQFDDPLKKSSLDSDDLVSKTELRKKRKNRYSEVQGSSTPATRILRSMTKTAVAVLPSSSVELQNSEVASCHKCASVSPCYNDGSLDLSDPKNTSVMEKYELLNSSEMNFVTDGNDYPSQTEEWEAAKVVDGRERSGCSQFNDPSKKSSLNSDDQVSKTELLKKMKNRYSEIQGSSGTPTRRMSRSMTKTAVMVLPRRSPRLISE